MDFKGKTALVTGASRGIGREIALTLGRRGANVVINYSRDEKGAEKVLQELEQIGSEGLIIKADVTSVQDVNAMVKEVLDKYERIDILVNNAGITRDSLLVRMKEEDWDSVLDTNLKGVFNCTKGVARHMMRARQGSIINISSVIGITGNVGQSNYAAAKAGIIGFSKSMAKELAPRGIRVNAIAPGFIDTDMTAVLNDKIKQSILSNIPLNRYGKPEEIAQVVAFLASEQSSYITGQVINVDGGMII